MYNNYVLFNKCRYLVAEMWFCAKKINLCMYMYSITIMYLLHYK